jgi:hypothetical protein
MKEALGPNMDATKLWPDIDAVECWLNGLEQLPAFQIVKAHSQSSPESIERLRIRLVDYAQLRPKLTTRFLRNLRNRGRKEDDGLQTTISVLEYRLRIATGDTSVANAKLAAALRFVIASLKKEGLFTGPDLHSRIGQKLNARSFVIRDIVDAIPCGLVNRSSAISQLLRYAGWDVDRKLVTATLADDARRHAKCVSSELK